MGITFYYIEQTHLLLNKKRSYEEQRPFRKHEL